MSHFSVGVIIKKEDKYNLIDAVTEAMDPFDENKICEPRLDLTREEVQQQFNEILNYKGDSDFRLKLKEKYKTATLEEFTMGYYCSELEEEGIYTTYNENSKWDWYVVGGRWNGELPIKNRENTELVVTDSYCDNYVDNVCKIKDLVLKEEKTEKELNELRETYNKIISGETHYNVEYFLKKYPTIESYIDYMSTFSTYALLTSDGVWHEPGQIGWFGTSSAKPEEEVNFKNRFEELLAQEDPDNLFVLVDCHI